MSAWLLELPAVSLVVSLGIGLAKICIGSSIVIITIKTGVDIYRE